MTARTLEEIEALAKDATPGPWMLEPNDPLCITREDPGWASSDQLDIGFTNDQKRVAFMNHDVGDDSTEWFASQEKAIANAALISALPDLLAIAQRQREALKAKDAEIADLEERLRLAARKANNAIYFDDSSDFRSALFEIADIDISTDQIGKKFMSER